MHSRSTFAEINLQALRDNFHAIRERLPEGVGIMAVVKADAYGHGAIAIGRELENMGVDFLAVAYLEEGVELRRAGIKVPIIVLCSSVGGNEEHFLEWNLTPVVFNINDATSISEASKKRGIRGKIHVKVDTGMGRLGLMPDEVKGFIREIKHLDGILIEGLLSHFAVAEDEEEEKFTREQLSLFLKLRDEFLSAGIRPTYFHIANSAAIFSYPESLFNLVRAGITLYGAYPSPSFMKKVTLRSIMRIKTKILHLKEVGEGFSISYGRTFITKRRSIIGTLPFGYADGYSRKFSNRAYVLVKGRRAPVVGRVCMDLTMVDLTDIVDVKVGDEVVLLGRQGDEEITPQQWADWAETIPYEIFCSIGKRVPRIYIYE